MHVARHPPTTSLPSSIAAIKRGISSGGFCRSASSVTTISPRDCRKPARIAECCPKLRANSTTRTRPSSPAAIWRRRPRESSRDPSSTKTVSHGRPRASRTGLRRDQSEPRFADSLNTGTTTDTNPLGARDMAEAPRIGDILPGKLKERARPDRRSIHAKPPSREVIVADSLGELKIAPGGGG